MKFHTALKNIPDNCAGVFIFINNGYGFWFSEKHLAQKYIELEIREQEKRPHLDHCPTCKCENSLSKKKLLALAERLDGEYREVQVIPNTIPSLALESY